MASFTDDFSRSAVTAVGSNWVATGYTSTFIITSGQIYSTNATMPIAVYVNTTTADFTDNHAAEIQIAVSGLGDRGGPAVRCTSTGFYCILGVATATNTSTDAQTFLKYVYVDGSGSWSQTRIGNFHYGNFAAGTRLKLTVTGNVLRGYKDDSLCESLTHSALTTGQPGLTYWRSNTNATRLDNFSAVDLSTYILTSISDDNAVYSQEDAELKGTGLSAGVTVTYNGLSCAVNSASSSTSVKLTMPDFYTNNMKLGATYELKVS